jgi:hypothetical protein
MAALALGERHRVAQANRAGNPLSGRCAADFLAAAVLVDARVVARRNRCVWEPPRSIIRTAGAMWPMPGAGI